MLGLERGRSVHEGQSGHTHLPGGSWSPSSRRRLGDGPVHSRPWEGSTLTKHSEGSRQVGESLPFDACAGDQQAPSGPRSGIRGPTWGAASPGAERLPVLAGSPL